MHIVITGANRGIGLEFCHQFKAQGHELTALCRTTSPELEQLGVTVVENVDVRKPPEFTTLQPVDWLLLNAGIWRDESLEDLNFETILEQFEVNSLGPMRIFQKISHKLGEGSKIGLVTSQMSSMTDNTSGGRYGYRGSKAALNAFGVSLALDLKARGIAVALLHPGYVATDMTDNKGSIQPSESVAGLMKVMQKLHLENSGKFWNYRGEVLPW